MTTAAEPAWQITPEKVQVVVPYSRFEALREKLGLIYREAGRHGKVVVRELKYGTRRRR
jgi:hypothetical protein